jgi:hypothetical protein
MSEGPPPIDYPPILFGTGLIFGIIYIGVGIFVISSLLAILAFKEVSEGYTKYWGKILHYSFEIMLVSGLSTLMYTIALFGFRHAYYAIGTLIISLIVSNSENCYEKTRSCTKVGSIN